MEVSDCYRRSVYQKTVKHKYQSDDGLHLFFCTV